MCADDQCAIQYTLLTLLSTLRTFSPWSRRRVRRGDAALGGDVIDGDVAPPAGAALPLEGNGRGLVRVGGFGSGLELGLGLGSGLEGRVRVRVRVRVRIVGLGLGVRGQGLEVDGGSLLGEVDGSLLPVVCHGPAARMGEGGGIGEGAG